YADRTAASENDRPVVVDRREVAGRDPANTVHFDKGVRGFLRVLVVPEWDVTASREAADDSRPRCYGLQIVVEDGDVIAWREPERLRRAGGRRRRLGAHGP